MNINDVFEKDGKPHIVTYIDNKGVMESMEVREFIAKNRIIQYNGTYKSISEILNDEVANALKNTTIVKI